MINSCRFGVQKNDSCHKVSYVKETGVKKIEEFEEKLEMVCLHREYILLRIFPVTQTNKSCDPLKNHETK